MSDLLLGLDMIDVNESVGLKFDWIAGYAGGMWPTFAPECAMYPELAKQNRVLSYAVTTAEDAELGDCESGDMSVEELASIWLPRQIQRGVWRPGAYANLDRWRNEGLWDALAHYGSSIRRICADYDYEFGLIAGFDCQQYTDRYAGRNVDGNASLPTFLPPAPQPPHKNDLHYEWFATGQFPTAKWGTLVEHDVVADYDGARQQPEKYSTYLPKLQAQLWWLRNRVCYEAIIANPLPNGKPSWSEDKRGWRQIQLARRANGHRFA